MIEKSTSIVDKPLKSDYKDNMIKPDTSVDFRKKRLAVACAIAEKENKFMVSFAFLVLKLFKQISVPWLLDIVRQLTDAFPSFTKTTYW